MRTTLIRAPLLLALLILPVALFAGDDDDDSSEEIPFDVAEIFVELNDTDGDLGIHALIDGEPWRRLEIESVEGRNLLKIKARSQMARQGLTELFFESAEPDFDEVTPEEYFARFPEGMYEISGVTTEGDELESETFFSHVLADRPGNIEVSGVAASEDCDTDVPEVTPPITISWDPVTTSHPELGAAGPVEVLHYQLVVEREEPSLLIYSIDLPPDLTEMTVPDAFIALAEEFKFEILVRTTTFNNTAFESCFAVGD